MSRGWWVLAAVVLALGAPLVQAKKAKPTPCAPGRFTIAPADSPLLGPVDGTADALDWSDTGTLSSSQCFAAPLRVKARGAFTRLRSRWAACGTVRRVRIKARIGAPGCTAMTGTIRGRGLPPRAFVATRDATTTTTPVSSTTTSTAIVCDTCASACVPSPGGTTGTTAGRHNDYGFGGGACVEFYDGPDVLYATEVPGGHTLTVTATPTAFFDVGLAIVLDCDDINLACQGQGNDAPAGGVETMTYVNPSVAPKTVYVVVDSPTAFAGNFTLDLQTAPTAP